MEGKPSPEPPDAGSEPAITPELIELCMDRVARAIVRDEKRGVAYLPIYDRLSVELASLKQRAATLTEIRARVKRSLDRTRMP
ncbi:MAG: hypothetical protein RIB55_13080 [Nitratireductor sp.]